MDISNLRIMIVEDEAFMRQLIRQSLQQLNCINFITAKDGVDGLEKYRLTWPKLDLILCDLIMPELDGFGFIDLIRNSDEKFRHDIPIIVLTGNAQEENFERAAKLGINGFLLKPVSAGALEKKITSAMTAPAR